MRNPRYDDRMVYLFVLNDWSVFNLCDFILVASMYSREIMRDQRKIGNLAEVDSQDLVRGLTTGTGK